MEDEVEIARDPRLHIFETHDVDELAANLRALADLVEAGQVVNIALATTERAGVRGELRHALLTTGAWFSAPADDEDIARHVCNVKQCGTDRACAARHLENLREAMMIWEVTYLAGMLASAHIRQLPAERASDVEKAGTRH